MKQQDPCGCFPTGRHYPGIAHLIRIVAVGAVTEMDPEASWISLPIAFLDTETTGVDSKTDRVIEVGIVLGRDGKVESRHNWLINPGIPIPPDSTAIHGISDADVADKPTFGDVAKEIAEVLRGYVPAAYNASFDRGFIHAEYNRANAFPPDSPPALRNKVTWLDPLVFARELYKGKGESRALGAMAERLGVDLTNAHRATDDAEAALKVMYRMASDERIPGAYAAMLQEQRRLEQLQREAQRFWRN